MWLFIALVTVPIIEIALFIEVGGWLGLWPTIGIVILTALLGAALLRQQGLAQLREIEARVKRGEDPRGPLLHGLLILIAGIVLLTPGFFTDAVGFALLVRPIRQMLIESIGRRIVVAAVTRQQQQRQGPRDGFRQHDGSASAPGGRGTTIETEYEDVTDYGDGKRPSGWTQRD